MRKYRQKWINNRDYGEKEAQSNVSGLPTYNKTLHKDIQAGHQPHLGTWLAHLHNHYHQGDWNGENGQDSSYEGYKYTVRTNN